MQGTGDAAANPWAALDGRGNALNFLRLVLASVVAVKHSWNVAHNTLDGLPYIAGYAVDGFFCLSGYLITGSRRRLDGFTYAKRRALRILPGLWGVLLLTAFVTAPLAAVLQGKGYDWTSGLGYLWNNALLQLAQPAIGDTLADAPIADVWNAPLWTLEFEALAYLVFGLVLTWRGFGRKSALVLYGAVAASLLVYVLPEPPQVASAVARLFGFFAAGVLMWFWRDSLPASPRAAIAAAVVLAGSVTLPYPLYLLVAPIPMAFLLLWLGANLPTRIGARNDISYGVYIHAYPLTQLLVVTGVAAALGDVLFGVVALLVTVPVAWASWWLVERPAMRLRLGASSSPRVKRHRLRPGRVSPFVNHLAPAMRRDPRSRRRASPAAGES